MKNKTVASVLAAVAASTLLLPALVGQPASAARLVVTAAPIQFWDIVDGLPELPQTPPLADLMACGDPSDYDEIIYGTPGNDVLEAGNGRQILVGQEGDDVLAGGNHDDCLLGGPGNDVLDGGNGRDILIGGLGADHLDGGNGKDRLDAGGDQGDTCVTNGAPDELVGCGADEAGVADAATPSDLDAGDETTAGPVDEADAGTKDKDDKPGAGHATGNDKSTPNPGAGGSAKPSQAPQPTVPDAPASDATGDVEAAATEPVPGE